MEDLRRRARRDRLLQQRDEGATAAEDLETQFLSGARHDDLLRMLFLCCDSSIPIESHVLALKTLCGFDVGEIAERLFTTGANVYKRASAGLVIAFESFRLGRMS